MSKPFCLIDCDVIKYKCGFAIEKRDKETEIITIEPIKHAFYNINSMIKKCIRRCETDQFQCFVTPLNSKDNFRFNLFPDYKANRAGIRKPHYIHELHQYLVRRWQAIESKGEEADDTISIVHYKYNMFGFDDTNNINSVICSIDKDFDNCAGWHYNPGKDEFYFVREIQALRNFYLQILTGDTADNIPRVKKGWRQQKTEEKIQKACSEKELYDIVLEVCNEIFIDKNETWGRDWIQRNGQLVWLRRKENEVWEPNLCEVLKNEPV